MIAFNNTVHLYDILHNIWKYHSLSHCCKRFSELESTASSTCSATFNSLGIDLSIQNVGVCQLIHLDWSSISDIYQTYKSPKGSQTSSYVLRKPVKTNSCMHAHQAPWNLYCLLWRSILVGQFCGNLPLRDNNLLQIFRYELLQSWMDRLPCNALNWKLKLLLGSGSQMIIA